MISFQQVQRMIQFVENEERLRTDAESAGAYCFNPASYTIENNVPRPEGDNS